MANEATNKVRFGLSDVAIAPLTGPGTYGDITKIPGAVSLSTSPEGGTEKFFADNGAYYTCVTNAGYTGDLRLGNRQERRPRGDCRCCSQAFRPALQG